MNKHYQEVINVEDYEKFLDVPMSIEVELGYTKISLKELLNLEKKSVIDLGKPAGENVEIYVNKRIIARGEVMVLEKNLAIRINEIPEYDSVIKYLKDEKSI